MSCQQVGLTSSGIPEGAPLAGLSQDRRPGSDISDGAEQPTIVQEPVTPRRQSSLVSPSPEASSVWTSASTSSPNSSTDELAEILETLARPSASASHRGARPPSASARPGSSYSSINYPNSMVGPRPQIPWSKHPVVSSRGNHSVVPSRTTRPNLFPPMCAFLDPSTRPHEYAYSWFDLDGVFKYDGSPFRFEDDVSEVIGYDVEVEKLVMAPSCPRDSKSELAREGDQEGWFDEASMIDTHSICLDQTNGKAPDTFSNEPAKKRKGKTTATSSRFHRVRIVMPSFRSFLFGLGLGPMNTWIRSLSGGSGSVNNPLGNNPKPLSAEWISEGRHWMLSIGRDMLMLTLQETNTVFTDPVKVKAIVRIIPLELDIKWTQVKEVDHIGTDRLLPTQIPSDIVLSNATYECKFEEKVLFPGPVGVGMESSMWKTGIKVSEHSPTDLIGPYSGIRIEVVIRVDENVEKEAKASAVASIAERTSVLYDAIEWQLVEPH